MVLLASSARRTARDVLPRRLASREENGSSSSTTRRLRGERAGERHALLLAAGELVGPAVAEVGGQLDEVEHLGDAVGAACARSRQAERDVGRHVEVREERALLRDVADAARLRRHRAYAVAGHDRVAEGDAARLGREEAGDQAQQRGLAAARGAEHRREGAVRHVEGDVVDGAGRRAEATSSRR